MASTSGAGPIDCRLVHTFTSNQALKRAPRYQTTELPGTRRSAAMNREDAAAVEEITRCSSSSR